MRQRFDPTRPKTPPDLLGRIKSMLQTNAAALVDAFHGRLSAVRPAEPGASCASLKSANDGAPADCAAADIAVIRAQGKAVAMLAAVLASANVTPMKEFGDLLAVFAVTVSETDPEEGQILAYWASIVRDGAAASPSA